MPNVPTADIEATIADVDAADASASGADLLLAEAITLLENGDYEAAAAKIGRAKDKNTSIRIKIAAARAKLMAMLLL